MSTSIETLSPTEKRSEKKITPMMMQWYACKKKAPDAILFFRLGDFYESFEQDAEIASKELDLTLTERQGTLMCGIPWHTSEGYIDRLVAKGFKVAVAEQMEDPKKTKGLVARDIVRVVTPATVVSSGLLVDKTHNFFASIYETHDTFGLAFIDLTTASFFVLEHAEKKEIMNELFRRNPKELLLPKGFQEKHAQFIIELRMHSTLSITEQPKWLFEWHQSYDYLCRHFSVKTLDGFGLKEYTASIQSAGALLQYLSQSLLACVEHVTTLTPHNLQDGMLLDRATLSNLEILDPIDPNRPSNTLFSILDATKTAMGARLLKNWLQKPLVSVEEITLRQDAIQDFLDTEKTKKSSTESLDIHLKEIRDLERQMSRIKTGCASPRDYVSLAHSCKQIPHIQQFLTGSFSKKLKALEHQLNSHDPLVLLIEQAIVTTPPIRASDGGVIREGFSQELDELRYIRKNSKDWLITYQEELKKETDIKTLKISYNRLFGYFIEITKSQLNKVPESFQRRQTLVNTERYITPKLKEFEEKMLSSEERIAELEQTLFEQVHFQIARWHKEVLQSAKILAEIDCLRALSITAKKHNYTRPIVDTSTILDIQEGRHPVIEQLPSCGQFIPNNLFLNGKDQSLMCITGPNMAGKSTYIRQAALLAILAQIGSFIPAKNAHIGIIDKVFSRIGASDDLARGHSTFMVEMAETASILHQATERSLVILDEIGRGTSTYDGISIAWAVAEELAREKNSLRTKTLFATHYFELTQLEGMIPGIVNWTVAVSETAYDIIFLRKIIRGTTDKSYGIHVAKIAGLPESVIVRAKSLLKDLETKERTPKKKQEVKQQVHPIIKMIKEVDCANITPLQALQLLMAFQEKV